MGTVHVARLVGSHGFDRTFAIKRLLAQDAARAEVTAFIDEARLSARIIHPNVVETLDLGEHEGAPYLVMPLVAGVSLARLLGKARDKGARLDPYLAAWIG